MMRVWLNQPSAPLWTLFPQQKKLPPLLSYLLSQRMDLVRTNLVIVLAQLHLMNVNFCTMKSESCNFSHQVDLAQREISLCLSSVSKLTNTWRQIKVVTERVEICARLAPVRPPLPQCSDQRRLDHLTLAYYKVTNISLVFSNSLADYF